MEKYQIDFLSKDEFTDPAECDVVFNEEKKTLSFSFIMDVRYTVNGSKISNGWGWEHESHDEPYFQCAYNKIGDNIVGIWLENSTHYLFKITKR